MKKQTSKQSWISAVTRLIAKYRACVREDRPYIGYDLKCSLCIHAREVCGVSLSSIMCAACIQKRPYRKTTRTMSCLGMKTYDCKSRVRMAFWMKALKILKDLPAYRFEPGVISKRKTAFPELWKLDENLYNQINGGTK